ncbi:MAG TPA: alpha/beta hydrolase-fold protein [Vicinamibacterales bacterium]|nr:alpha/beta hydrolase-fold protein [Vicinamibacterales bacterium]
MIRLRAGHIVAAAAMLCASFVPAFARQAPPSAPAPGQGRGPQAPQVVSPEVSADRHVTFRIYAPQAQSIRLNAGDIPNIGQSPAATLTKGGDGVWTTTVGPVEPGAYRYTFNVDGVATIDPRSPAISESNNNVWSVAYVAGSDLFDSKHVPHGAVASVTYYSTALGRDRRMHVYTPPGYENGSTKYPVFYLLHGAGDSDDSWTSVGRAGFILDNLIATKKAKPMIVVMPAGHTNGPIPGVGAAPAATPAAAGAPDDFTRDFTMDVMPYVEKHYRVLTDRANRAIAGLSMGGSQTLNVAFAHLNEFAYIGVFSSGLLGGGRGRGAGPAAGTPAPPFGEAWEKQNLASLDDAALKKGLKLVWFSTGKDDGLITTSRSTVDLLKKHGFTVQFTESNGAHTWLNWRDYLTEFTPQLFQ